MAGRRAGAGLALAAVALIAAGCGLGGSTKTVTSTVTRTVTTTRTVTQQSGGSASPCTGAQLSGTFAVIPGTQGAGQISYELTLTNTSSTSCSLSGPPQVELLGVSGSSLPTTPRTTGPVGSVVLGPSIAGQIEARFSPDVPGQGDNQSGACQPKAHTLRVVLPGVVEVNAPIKPATSVCEQGTLSFGQYGLAG